MQTFCSKPSGKKIALAVNFNGEQEQLRVINEALSHSQRRGMQKVDRETLAQLRDPYGLGTADLIIRTGAPEDEGKSLSGLGLDGPGTQLAFSSTLFPDFSSREFAQIIVEYKERRMGGRPKNHKE